MANVDVYVVKDERSRTFKQGYSLRIQRSTTIGKRELAKYVEADSHIDHARVEYIMAAVVKQLKEMVLNGHKVNLGELGVIGLSCHSTGSECEEEVSVKNNVKGMQITFRPSMELKEELAQTKGRLVTRESREPKEQLSMSDVVILRDKEKK